MGKFYEAPCIVESYNTAISQSRSLHIFRPPLATLRCCFGPSKLKTNYTDTLSGNKLNCTVSYAKKLYLRCMRFVYHCNLRHPLSERLAVIAFAARRLDVFHRRSVGLKFRMTVG